MSRRSFKEIRKAILKALNDSKPHSFGDLERQVNTNWQTIRTHCEDLNFFKAVTISKDNKVKITKTDLDVLKKL